MHSVSWLPKYFPLKLFETIVNQLPVLLYATLQQTRKCLLLLQLCHTFAILCWTSWHWKNQTFKGAPKRSISLLKRNLHFVMLQSRQQPEHKDILPVHPIRIVLFPVTQHTIMITLPVKNTRISPGGSVKWICITVMREASR